MIKFSDMNKTPENVDESLEDSLEDLSENLDDVNEDDSTETLDEGSTFEKYSSLSFGEYGIGFSSRGEMSPTGKSGVERWEVGAYRDASETKDSKKLKAIMDKMEGAKNKWKGKAEADLEKCMKNIEKYWMEYQKDLEKLK